jgi:Na+/proline symporter
MCRLWIVSREQNLHSIGEVLARRFLKRLICPRVKVIVMVRYGW